MLLSLHHKTNVTTKTTIMISTADKNKGNILLRAFKEGDDRAFSKIYDMYVSPLFNYGLCLSQDRELVKDCIQDVFTKFYTKRNAKIDNVGSYLFISLRNKLLDEFRRASYSNEDTLDKVAFRIGDTDIEGQMLDTEKSNNNHLQVAKLMSSLTPRQREVITLYYLEERKYDEICERMNLNYHSVRNLVHRSMLKLRAAAV